MAENGNEALLGMSFSHSGQCFNCRHYNGGKKCNAFPGGIPDLVFDDVVIHDRPLEGNNGKVFELKPVHMPAPQEPAPAKPKVERIP